MRDDHKEEIRVFREVDNVDRALKNQLSEALPEIYIKRFRDRHTNTLNDSSHNILKYLFDTYGDLTPEELSSTEEKVKTKVFDITQPLIVMFNEIQDLQDMAIAANNAY